MTLLDGNRSQTATANKDWTVSWAARLSEYGDKLASATWSSSPAGLGIGTGAYAPTISSDGLSATVWLTGGTPGTTYTINCHGVTDNVPAREDDLSFTLTIEDTSVGGSAGPDEGDVFVWSGLLNSYVPKRLAIIPDFDYGVNGDPDKNRTIWLALLARVRQGAWILWPDAVINMRYANTTDHLFADKTQAPGSDRYIGVLPQGVTLTGVPHGFKQPHTIYNNGYTNSGTLLRIYASTGNAAVAHAGEVFRGGVNTMVADIEAEYVDQTHNPTSTVVGAPGSFTPYGALLHAVANYHGVTFQNIICHNPYNFLIWEANGGKLHTLRGFPLYRGITFPRCGAAPDTTDIQFNPVGSYLDQPSVATWVKANGLACMLDGVEGWRVRGFNIFGYNEAIEAYDEDNDGFTGVYFVWSDPDIEACNTIFRVHNTGRTYQPLADIGAEFTAATFVPEIAGYGFDFADTAVPANFNNRPKVRYKGTFHSSVAGMSRAVWQRSTSYGIFDWDGGGASQVANEVIRNDSPNAFWDARFDSPTGVRRWAGTGPGRDRGGMVR